MSERVTIRLAATDDERLAMLALAHRANGSPLLLAYYQAQRLAHPKRARAQWWMLEHEGRVAAALMCYALRFAVGGSEPIAGYGLGAVVTAPELRRRGLASRLCQHVAERSAEQGRSLGLLFSAIAPGIYERLGYRVAPAWDLSCTKLAALRQSGVAAELLPLDARRRLDEVVALYGGAHPALHVHRDEECWQRSIADAPTERYFAIGAPARGYARVTLHEHPRELEILELCPLDDADRLPALRALAELALQLGCESMSGWLQSRPELMPFFVDTGRARTLPMFTGDLDLTDSQLWPSDYF